LQGRRQYIFKVFIEFEYPLNLGSGCISMFSVNLTFDKTLMMQFLISKAKKRCSRRLLSRESQRISAQTLYCQKLPKICALQYVSIFISFHAIMFRMSHSLSHPNRRKKQNLKRNSHSRSFKVIHFGITEKPTTDCESPYNDAVLI